jgi:hypothetical protein
VKKEKEKKEKEKKEKEKKKKKKEEKKLLIPIQYSYQPLVQENLPCH